MTIWPWLDFEWWLCNSYYRRKLRRAPLSAFSHGKRWNRLFTVKGTFSRFRRRSSARTCTPAKSKRLKILLTIYTCYQMHRPPQRSATLAYFCHSSPLGGTHTADTVSESLACLFIAVDIVQLRCSAAWGGRWILNRVLIQLKCHCL